MADQITRSPGLAVGGFIVGGGQNGATAELDALVQEAAQALAKAYGKDVTIRFNSNRESGGAWLQTHKVDRIGANSEIGIRVSHHVVDEKSIAFAKEYNLPEEPIGESMIICAYIRATSLADISFANNMIEMPGQAYANIEVDNIQAAIALLKEKAVLRDSYEATEPAKKPVRKVRMTP